MKIIQLGRESAAEFWRLRLLLFKELGEVADDTNPHGLEAATRAYYFTHTGKDLVTWGVPDGKRLAAIGSLSLFERAPYQENPTGKEGYLFNIYTCPAFRKQGFATAIVKEIIRYASDTSIKRLWLSSSVCGKRIYEQCGFVDKGTEMECFL